MSGTMSMDSGKMRKYRMLMDLSDIFEDEQVLSFILIDPKWNRVSCVEDHVKFLFGVPEVFLVTQDGIYVPSQESIEVIRRTDMLRAIVPNKCKKKKKKLGLADGFGDGLRTIRFQGRKHKRDEADELSAMSTAKKCRTSVPPRRRKLRVSIRREIAPPFRQEAKLRENSEALAQEDPAIKKPFPEQATKSAEETILSTLTEPLNGFPCEGDLILFKITQSDGKTLSDYICGCCEEVDHIRHTVTCLLLDDADKFDRMETGITTTSGNGVDQDGTLVELNLDDMLDKRIIKIPV